MQNFFDRSSAPYAREKAYHFTGYLFIAIFLVVITALLWFSRDQVQLKAPRTLTIYSFSGLETVMEEALLPAFQERWMKTQHEQLSFISTFAGSGVITRQILTRFPAEVALLSSELDVLALSEGWITSTRALEDPAVFRTICRSPIAMVLRDSSRDRNLTLDQLDHSGLRIIIADPLSSGSGQLAALALYGSWLRQGRSHQDALAYARTFFYQGAGHPSDARAGLSFLQAGLGDVLLSYEATGKQRDLNNQLWVVQPEPLLISEPVALIITKNISPEQLPLAKAFLDFLVSEQSQRIFSEYGFRPLDQGMNLDSEYPLDSLGTINQLSRQVLKPILEQQIRRSVTG